MVPPKELQRTNSTGSGQEREGRGRQHLELACVHVAVQQDAPRGSWEGLGGAAHARQLPLGFCQLPHLPGVPQCTSASRPARAGSLGDRNEGRPRDWKGKMCDWLSALRLLVCMVFHRQAFSGCLRGTVNSVSLLRPPAQDRSLNRH